MYTCTLWEEFMALCVGKEVTLEIQTQSSLSETLHFLKEPTALIKFIQTLFRRTELQLLLERLRKLFRSIHNRDVESKLQSILGTPRL